MASPTQRTWVWANSRRWWRTGKPGVLWSMGLQRVGRDWATEQQPWIMEAGDHVSCSDGDHSSFHFISLPKFPLGRKIPRFMEELLLVCMWASGSQQCGVDCNGHGCALVSPSSPQIRVLWADGLQLRPFSNCLSCWGDLLRGADLTQGHVLPGPAHVQWLIKRYKDPLD